MTISVPGSLPGPHVAVGELSRYAAGLLPEVEESLLEEHLLSCAACRGLVPSVGAVDGQRLDVVWADVVDILDRPRLSVVERALHRLGVRQETSRLIAAAPSLRIPWLVAIAGCLLLAVAAANTGGARGSWLFLTLAPLMPVAGVAAAYGPHVDACWELARATSYSLARLCLVRVTAVLCSTLPLAVLVGLLLPGSAWWVAAVWLLPALAFVMVTLWAATYVDALFAAGVLAAGWAAVTTSAMWHHSDPALLLHPFVQFAFAGAAAFAAAGLWSRRGSLAGSQWLT
jgi:hypothetical protein